MNKIIKGLLLSLAVAVVSVSCKKEEEPKKVNVNEVAGEYVAAYIAYTLNSDGTIGPISNDFEDSFEIDLINVTVNGTTITAKDSDGELIFASRDLIEAENGVGWNLNLDQSLISEMAAQGIDIYGFENYEYNGKKYQAFYDANEKEIAFSLAFVNESEEIAVILEFTCAK